MKPIEAVEHLARELGVKRVSPTTLMHWEEYNLLNDVGQTASGRREYTDENVARLKIITVLKAVQISSKLIVKFLAGDQHTMDYVFESIRLYESKLMPYAKSLLPENQPGAVGYIKEGISVDRRNRG